MPQKRSDMRRVKEVLRLAHELGYSLRQIAESVRLGRTSVRDYLTRADAAGVRYEDVADKGEAEIEALLFRRQSRRSRDLSQIGQRSRRSWPSRR
jgi:DNA-binding transcriptional regulator LsrR (DeoR family)